MRGHPGLHHRPARDAGGTGWDDDEGPNRVEDRGGHHTIPSAMYSQPGEVISNDPDFGRFEGVRWVNPLAATT